MNLKSMWRARFILIPCLAVGLGSVALMASLCLNATAYQAPGYHPSFSPLPAPQPRSATYLPPPATHPRAKKRLSLEQRQRRWWPEVRRLSRRHGLDPALVMGVIQVESRFKGRAVSHRGALGLMQIVPLTAEELGLEDPLDPQANLEAGVRYLARLKRYFKGDRRLFLAAYNAGPTRVAALGAVPPNRETRGYVIKVLRQADHFREAFLALASN
jgi:soluble lytic murein transglycosylase-like protein